MKLFPLVPIRFLIRSILGGIYFFILGASAHAGVQYGDIVLNVANALLVN